MNKYEFVGTRLTHLDSFFIDGVDVNTETWRRTGNCVTVIDPFTKKTYAFTEYYITRDFNVDLVFASGQFENGKEAFFQKV